MSSYIPPIAPSNPLSLKPSYSAPAAFRNKKPPAAIDIWRHEVSSCTQPLKSSTSASTASSQSSGSFPSNSPEDFGGGGEMQRRPSFLQKLLQPKKSLAVLRGKRDDGEEGAEVKTEMYDLVKVKSRVEMKSGFKLKVSQDLQNEGGLSGVNGNPNHADKGSLDVEEDEGGGRSSMEILTSGSDSEEISSLKDRRARLERAERLLRKGKGKR